MNTRVSMAEKKVAKQATKKTRRGAAGSSPKRASMSKRSASDGESATALIDARIEELRDSRGDMLARMRALIRKADPAIVEEWKWGGPVWSCDGVICTGETYKSVVKLTFAKGAQLEDPERLFNSSLEGNVRRAIDIREGEEVDARAFTALVREAVAANRASRSAKR